MEQGLEEPQSSTKTRGLYSEVLTSSEMPMQRRKVTEGMCTILRISRSDHLKPSCMPHSPPGDCAGYSQEVGVGEENVCVV